MSQLLAEYLANGGTIAQLAAAPVTKYNHVPAKTQLLNLLRKGAMHRDSILQHMDERTLNTGYRSIRSSGIPIIQRDGWYALDQADLPQKAATPSLPKVMALPKIKLTEQQIAYALAKYYLNGKHVLVVNNFYWTGYECDLFCITKGLRPIEFEIKISRDDFFADAKKLKWQRPVAAWKHYYIMPEHIYSPDMLDRLPHVHSGILTIDLQGEAIYIVERKKAQANSVAPIKPQQLVDITRLVALRLWRTT